MIATAGFLVMLICSHKGSRNPFGDKAWRKLQRV